jgi:tetratricopeptide (TPR) repeat protein
VPRRKIISVVAAVVLTLGTLTPRPALASRPTPLTVNAVSVAQASDGAQPPSRKGNKLGRALSAPFRALAKLFGGGDGRKKQEQEARRRDARTAPEAQAAPADETRAAAAVKTLPPVLEPASIAAEPARASASPARPDAAASEGTRIIRPSEAAAAAPASPVTKAIFIPRIEGVPPDHLSQGRALLQHGYLNEAIAELSIAASVGSGLVEANNLLGLAYDRIGWHVEAAKAYERALTVAPKDPVVLANLGNSLYLADDYRAALKRLKQSIKLSPGTAVVHNNIGIVEARLGKYDNAFKSFARASNTFDAHLKLAGILEIEKRERDAARHYEAALRLQPGTAAILERLVALYERTGRAREAEEARRTLGQPANPQKTATGGG